MEKPRDESRISSRECAVRSGNMRILPLLILLIGVGYIEMSRSASVGLLAGVFLIPSLLTYGLYPVLSLFLKTRRAVPFSSLSEGAPQPATLVIVARDEEESLSRKLDSLREVHYEELHVWVVSDGSRDQTAIIAEAHPVVSRVIAFPQTQGKTRATLEVVPDITTPLVFFTDATGILESEALPSLAQVLSQDDVGCAGGLVRYVGEKDCAPTGFGLYQRVVRLLRQAEGELGNSTVVSGALHGIRRECIPMGIPDDVSLELAVPLQSASMGKAIVYVTNAVCWEEGGRAWRDEWAARRRMGLRSWSFLAYFFRQMGAIRKPGYLFHLIGHKLLRWISAPCLFVALFLGLLHGAPLVQGGLIATVGLAVFGMRFSASALVQSLGFFVLVNAAFLVSFVEWCLGVKARAWQPRR